jgi:hypothetical protein
MSIPPLSPGYRCQLPRIPRGRTCFAPSVEGWSDLVTVKSTFASPGELLPTLFGKSITGKKFKKLSPPSASHRLTSLICYLIRSFVIIFVTGSRISTCQAVKSSISSSMAVTSHERPYEGNARWNAQVPQLGHSLFNVLSSPRNHKMTEQATPQKNVATSIVPSTLMTFD